MDRDMKMRIMMTSRSVVATVFLVMPVYLLALVGDAHSQSLSDFDLGRFEKRTSEYRARTHTDPFEGGGFALEDMTVEDLELTGIAYRSDGNSYALISGYLVREGDRIAGFHVDRIERDRVRLSRVDEVFVLALSGGM